MPSTLFSGDGAAARAQAAFDWSTHPLGTPDGWPPSLLTAVRLMMGAPVPMCMTWGVEEHFFFNDAYVPALGAKMPRAVGTTLPILWDDVYEQLRPMLEDCRRGRATRFEDIPLKLGRNGEPEDTWWSFFFSPLYDDTGTVMGMFCQTNETTEKALRFRQLLAIEQDYLALTGSVEERVAQRTQERGRVWELSNDLLAVSSTGDHMEITNPAWQRILGWEAAELAALAYPNFLHPEDVARTHNAFDEVRNGAPVARVENRLKRRDGGYRWFSWSIVGEDGHLYCSARDVTDEKASAEALALAQDQLRQAQKMDAVGQLTGGIAHDFNNIMGGILGCLELGQMRLAQGSHDDLPRLFALATSAAQRAAALTHRLLAFSRRQTLAPEPLDVNRLVAGLEDMVARSIGPLVQVEFLRAPDLWNVFADPSQVDNALLNLCINARDAMPGGGRIVIETANLMIDEAEATARGIAPGPYVSLRVTDSGTGMSADTMSRAFDPFFTTKPLGQGTGLGLSMVYGFARQSHGDVCIRSTEGQGTSVCLCLPRYDGPMPEAATPAPDAPLPTRDGTVLVLDDEASLRMLLVSVLTEEGFTVLEARDGPEALAILRSARPLDLLVSDVGLPGGMNGRQVADAARQARPGLPVIFMTGYAESAVLGYGDLDDGMEVVTKPFALADMLRRIKGRVGARETTDEARPAVTGRADSPRARHTFTAMPE